MSLYKERSVIMERDIFEMMQIQSKEKAALSLLASNERTEQFGLSLTSEDVEKLMVSRKESLKTHERIEFKSEVLQKLIDAFCDSVYLRQDNYVETLEQLQDIFFEYKNEAEENLTDDELITFMREQFDEICCGDIDYLANTCLERFCQAIRAGYEGYKESGGRGEYGQFSEEKRWDRDLYLSVLNELFW